MLQIWMTLALLAIQNTQRLLPAKVSKQEVVASACLINTLFLEQVCAGLQVCYASRQEAKSVRRGWNK